MSGRQKVLLCVVVLVIFIMSLRILWGDNGLVDLMQSRKERERIAEKNESIRRENVNLYREIERLNKDPEYLEEAVRKESNMIKPGEIVVRMKAEKEADK
ncbi:MAG: septum formation initiator family protein [Desulfobacterales bacterium]|jgi:cell division protein FtsB|nr:septum formation initiator family protein [Desulfobacterales bacterium]